MGCHVRLVEAERVEDGLRLCGDCFAWVHRRVKTHHTLHSQGPPQEPATTTHQLQPS